MQCYPAVASKSKDPPCPSEIARAPIGRLVRTRLKFKKVAEAQKQVWAKRCIIMSRSVMFAILRHLRFPTASSLSSLRPVAFAESSSAGVMSISGVLASLSPLTEGAFEGAFELAFDK